MNSAELEYIIRNELDTYDLVEFFGKVAACRDYMISIGALDRQKIQNAKIKHRIALIDRLGFPDYKVVLPDYEAPVSKYAQ